jgi:hypothetical protein
MARHIEEDTMHPILSQALAAERIREWHDQADRDQLMKRTRRARHKATPTAAELPPGPRSGFRWPTRRTGVPVVMVSKQSDSMTSERPAASDDRQSAGVRAA